MRLLTRENEELEGRILNLVAEKGVEGVKEKEMEESWRDGEGEEGLRKAVDGELCFIFSVCSSR